jgi:hypothetical protein
MSDQFLEQRINIEFCVKLRNNARDSCATFSDAYGREAMKKSNVFEWHKRFKKGHMPKSQMKAVHVTLFDIKGIVHFELVPQGRTINEAYCVEILKRLHEPVHRKRPELWPSDWIFYHDNAPAHEALSVK